MGVGRGNERSKKLETSKEHPRNMLATWLQLLHCSWAATALLRTLRRMQKEECRMKNGDQSHLLTGVGEYVRS